MATLPGFGSAQLSFYKDWGIERSRVSATFNPLLLMLNPFRISIGALSDVERLAHRYVFPIHADG